MFACNVGEGEREERAARLAGETGLERGEPFPLPPYEKDGIGNK